MHSTLTMCTAERQEGSVNFSSNAFNSATDALDPVNTRASPQEDAKENTAVEKPESEIIQQNTKLQAENSR